MYYSIYDHDICNYLYTGRNSKTKRQAFIDYLYYREPDLGEWWTLSNKTVSDKDLDEHYDKLFKEFVNNASDDYVLEDMNFCCFELVEHAKLLDNDWI